MDQIDSRINGDSTDESLKRAKALGFGFALLNIFFFFLIFSRSSYIILLIPFLTFLTYLFAGKYCQKHPYKVSWRIKYAIIIGGIGLPFLIDFFILPYIYLLFYPPYLMTFLMIMFLIYYLASMYCGKCSRELTKPLVLATISLIILLYFLWNPFFPTGGDAPYFFAFVAMFAASSCLIALLASSIRVIVGAGHV